MGPMMRVGKGGVSSRSSNSEMSVGIDDAVVAAGNKLTTTSGRWNAERGNCEPETTTRTSSKKRMKPIDPGLLLYSSRAVRDDSKMYVDLEWMLIWMPDDDDGQVRLGPSRRCCCCYHLV